MKKLIVFTDLDGSLLDHKTYAWSAAAESLNLLKQHQFPVILNSSKTSLEIKQFQQDMQINFPYISENGAVIHFNQYFPGSDTADKAVLGRPYAEIRDILVKVRSDGRYKLTGFGDMTIEQVAAKTGLKVDAATASHQREATEPFTWQDSASAFDKFTSEIKHHDLIVTRGGRFFHLMAPVTKGDAVLHVIEKFRQAEPETEWLSVGLGDSENDIPMLEQVDFPVLIHNPHAGTPDISKLDNIVVTEQAGPEGWNKALLTILNNITG